MQDEIFFKDVATEVTDLGGGVSRQVMGYDTRIMLVKVLFDEGSTGAAHEHPHSQASYVAEGVFEVTVGDNSRVLWAGDSFYVPGGVVHGVKCLEKGVLVDVFSPCREDFL